MIEVVLFHLRRYRVVLIEGHHAQTISERPLRQRPRFRGMLVLPMAQTVDTNQPGVDHMVRQLSAGRYFSSRPST